MPRPREKHWYALRIYRIMVQAKRDFSSERLETFVPYCTEKPEGKKNERKPLSATLIFVKCRRDWLMAYARENYPNVRYYKAAASPLPGEIPEVEMEIFMRATAPLGDGVRFFDDDAPQFHRGRKVLITDGRFKGMSGNVLRVGKDRKVLVSIQGVCALLISGIEPAFLQEVPE